MTDNLETMRRRQWAVEQVIASRAIPVTSINAEAGTVVLGADQLVKCAAILYDYVTDGTLPSDTAQAAS